MGETQIMAHTFWDLLIERQPAYDVVNGTDDNPRRRGRRPSGREPVIPRKAPKWLASLCETGHDYPPCACGSAIRGFSLKSSIQAMLGFITGYHQRTSSVSRGVTLSVFTAARNRTLRKSLAAIAELAAKRKRTVLNGGADNIRRRLPLTVGSGSSEKTLQRSLIQRAKEESHSLDGMGLLPLSFLGSSSPSPRSLGSWTQANSSGKAWQSGRVPESMALAISQNLGTVDGALGVVTEKGDWQISGAKRDAPANPNVSNLSHFSSLSSPPTPTTGRSLPGSGEGSRPFPVFAHLPVLSWTPHGRWSQQSWRLELLFGAKFCQMKKEEFGKRRDMEHFRKLWKLFLPGLLASVERRGSLINQMDEVSLEFSKNAEGELQKDPVYSPCLSTFLKIPSQPPYAKKNSDKRYPFTRCVRRLSFGLGASFPAESFPVTKLQHPTFSKL
ncbi:uncharacterized protein CLUP02_01248 [Colletotrichum lupini]|uniref:Uncharacterized protein n=1 Tax=Colletotrichum lupini TaxID=145971 RepID=A0A9Q8SDM3_9PEZI|nr:uncharacterized protein CLUP02_01248 [Colletotrichum lupini]UQC74597.1 hypothetical protein CLUP02_01248 [Colletotrichum lupini]